MRTIDAAAGGGQLLRWALGFAAIEGESIELTGIREARPTPGLRPQHLQVVRVLADLTNATVSGVREGATAIEFEPGEITAGRYEVDIGTAGSLTLLFDAVLSLTPVLPGTLDVTATGGTDVKWSPPVDYVKHVKGPLLRRLGIHAYLDVTRRGFYPSGGGRATLLVHPTDPERVEPRTTMDGVGPARLYSTATTDLAEAAVATRQADAANDRLAEAGIDVVETVISVVEADSTGSVIVVRQDCDPFPLGFDALGERGLPAEDVGEEAADAAVAFADSPGVVDKHMADQLVPLLAQVGGRLPIPAVTDHVETGVDLARTFGYALRIEETTTGPVLIAD